MELPGAGFAAGTGVTGVTGVERGAVVVVCNDAGVTAGPIVVVVGCVAGGPVRPSGPVVGDTTTETCERRDPWEESAAAAEPTTSTPATTTETWAIR